MSFAKMRSGKIHPDLGGDGGSSRGATPTGELSRTGSLRSQRSLIKRAGSSLGRAASLEKDEIAKGLNLGPEEHAEWLAEKVRREGRRDTRSLLRFYGRMLVPVAIMTMWVFVIVAVLSYSIPNLLCNASAKENSVSVGCRGYLWGGHARGGGGGVGGQASQQQQPEACSCCRPAPHLRPTLPLLLCNILPPTHPSAPPSCLPPFHTTSRLSSLTSLAGCCLWPSGLHI